jgi:hypothetical protein
LKILSNIFNPLLLLHKVVMEIDKNRNDLLIKSLESKNAKLPCSRCGENKFEIVGESLIPIQTNPNSIVIGGPSVPTALVACSNCGNISQHALGVLGMLKG